ncbi:MAG: SoxR reducing system RseC family protein [Bacteroidales bacterium]|nr:SoxR reducing system RseC family protein [Bacteroidales bacterium]
MEKISHIGIVEDIKGQAVQVRIQQASACDLCHAKSICSSADTKEKIVEVRAAEGSVSVGDKVMVEGAASMGMKAVFLAYVLPLILLILVMVLCLTLIAPGNEVVAALVSLGILLPYAVLLYLLKDKLSKKFRFEIRSLMNDIELR